MAPTPSESRSLIDSGQTRGGFNHVGLLQALPCLPLRVDQLGQFGQQPVRQRPAFGVLGLPRLEPERLRGPVDLCPLQGQDLGLHAPAGQVGEGDHPAERLR
jgi:hypothetical protein